MPIFALQTNVDIPDDFVESTSKLVAQLLGKPESYVMVTCTKVSGSFGGSSAPFANVRLTSIGKVSPPENKKHAKAITEHLNSALKVDGNRMYVQFEDVSPSMIAFNGSTFA